MNQSKKILGLKRRQWAIIGLILLVGLTVVLRYPEVIRRPPKRGDALLYLNNGREYARLIEQHDWLGVLNYNGSYEHPAFVKLVFGLGLVLRDTLALPLNDSV